MDTLVSVGTLAAFGWSLFALFLGSAGISAHVDLTAGRTDGMGNIYLAVAAGVTTFILTGRYFESRSKHRAGSALRELLDLAAKHATVLHRAPPAPDTAQLLPIAPPLPADSFLS